MLSIRKFVCRNIFYILITITIKKYAALEYNKWFDFNNDFLLVFCVVFVFFYLDEFVAHGSAVTCLALGQKSGRVMVTGGDDAKINLWAIGKPNCIMVSLLSQVFCCPNFLVHTKNDRSKINQFRSYRVTQILTIFSIGLFWLNYVCVFFPSIVCIELKPISNRRKKLVTMDKRWR